MRIRLSQEVIGMLREAREAYNVTNSEIVGKAIRKYQRIKPLLDVNAQETTYMGESYRLNITTELPPAVIRSVLQWYLNMNRPSPDHAKNQFKTDAVEGRDYMIKVV